MKGRDILIYLSQLYHGDWEKMYDAVQRKQPLEKEEVERTIEMMKGKAITIIDNDYPENFKHCVRPPLVIYYEGNAELLTKPEKTVAFVGSRIASPYALKKSYEIGLQMAKENLILINGVAKGIDKLSMEGLLDGHGQGIGVAGCGLDTIYPSENNEIFEKLRNTGLLISEYPYGVKPNPRHFPERNRLVVSLSNFVMIGEIKPKSGTHVTLNHALDMGKSIGVLPFQAGRETLNNQLIKDGANLIEDVRDILEALP